MFGGCPSALARFGPGKTQLDGWTLKSVGILLNRPECMVSVIGPGDPPPNVLLCSRNTQLGLDAAGHRTEILDGWPISEIKVCAVPPVNTP